MFDPSYLLSLMSLLYLMSHIGSSSANVVQRSMGCSLMFQLKGTTGEEKVKIYLDGAEGEFGLTKDWKDFEYPCPSGGQFSVEFLNDNGDRDVWIQGLESQVKDLLPEFERNSEWKCGTGNENERCQRLRDGNLAWNGKYTYTLKDIPACDDNGCDKAYDGKEGKGICVPTNKDDWNVINKDIDFTTPMKTGLCKSSGDTGCCGCFKQKLDKCEDKRCVPIPKKKIHKECVKKGEDVKPNMFNTGKMCAKRKDCYCFQNCKTTKKCKKSGGQCLGSAPKWPYQKKVKPCDKKKKCTCYIPIST